MSKTLSSLNLNEILEFIVTWILYVNLDAPFYVFATRSEFFNLAFRLSFLPNKISEISI